MASTLNAPPVKQRVFLFMTAAVAGVALFLCGMLVGQGTARRQGGEAGRAGAVAAFDGMRDEPRPAVLDVTSGEPSAAARNASDFTYPGRLDDPVPEAGPAEGGADGAGMKVPSWLKNNAKFWSEGQIGDREFAAALQWLISNGIVAV